MSSNRNTVIRTLHDIGAAAWFGGSLMGVIGVNGAAGDVVDPADRARVASAGWARWSPVQAAAIAAHGIGGVGLILANRKRVGHQSGVTANTITKAAVTLAAAGVTAYAGVLGGKVASAGRVPAQSGTVPSSGTPSDTAAAQKRLRLIQWLIPALTGVIVVMGAQQGEQQRPTEQALGLAHKAGQRVQKLAS